MEIVMETNSNDYERYKKAKKKVKEIKGFYSHLASYIMVISVLIFINLRYSPQYLWFIWTLLGWGFGVLGHAIAVFDLFSKFGKDWEERKIKEFMDEEKSKNKYQ
jgi:predicted membrane channel-forming protein YqfA (hemolysin III family)